MGDVVIHVPVRTSAIMAVEAHIGDSFVARFSGNPVFRDLAALVYCCLVDQGDIVEESFDDWLPSQAWPEVMAAGLAVHRACVFAFETENTRNSDFLVGLYQRASGRVESG